MDEVTNCVGRNVVVVPVFSWISMRLSPPVIFLMDVINPSDNGVTDGTHGCVYSPFAEIAYLEQHACLTHSTSLNPPIQLSASREAK